MKDDNNLLTPGASDTSLLMSNANKQTISHTESSNEISLFQNKRSSNLIKVSRTIEHDIPNRIAHKLTATIDHRESSTESQQKSRENSVTQSKSFSRKMHLKPNSAHLLKLNRNHINQAPSLNRLAPVTPEKKPNLDKIYNTNHNLTILGIDQKKTKQKSLTSTKYKIVKSKAHAYLLHRPPRYGTIFTEPSPDRNTASREESLDQSSLEVNKTFITLPAKPFSGHSGMASSSPNKQDSLNRSLNLSSMPEKKTILVGSKNKVEIPVLQLNNVTEATPAKQTKKTPSQLLFERIETTYKKSHQEDLKWLSQKNSTIKKNRSNSQESDKRSNRSRQKETPILPVLHRNRSPE